MTATIYNGPERRRKPRLSYPAGHCPSFTTGGQVFTVLDISEHGLRFDKEAHVPLKGWIRGNLALISGRDVDIDGVVVRDQPGDIGLLFITAIQSEALVEERRHIEAIEAGS